MSGPFTTISVRQYHRMQDVIMAAHDLKRARDAESGQAIAEAKLYEALANLDDQTGD